LNFVTRERERERWGENKSALCPSLKVRVIDITIRENRMRIEERIKRENFTFEKVQ
jgi:hypothetical protein